MGKLNASRRRAQALAACRGPASRVVSKRTTLPSSPVATSPAYAASIRSSSSSSSSSSFSSSTLTSGSSSDGSPAHAPAPAAPKAARKKTIVLPGAARLIPCGACVRSALAGQKRGACLSQASLRGKRCYVCAKHNHTCAPVSAAVKKAFDEFLELKSKDHPIRGVSLLSPDCDSKKPASNTR